MWFEHITHRRQSHQAPLLFLFPYSGGSHDVFLPLAEALQSIPIDLYALQLPGMGKRCSEPLCHDVHHLLNVLTQAMMHIIGSRSFYLYGHSTGALFASILSGRLIKKNMHAKHLFIAAESSPNHSEFDDDPLYYSDEDIIKKLKYYGRTDDEVLHDQDFIDFYVPIMRNEFSINYRLGHMPDYYPIHTQTTLIHGVDDVHVLRQDMEAWKDYTQYPPDWQEVRGDHFFIHHQAKNIAEIIGSKITDHIIEHMYS